MKSELKESFLYQYSKQHLLTRMFPPTNIFKESGRTVSSIEAEMNTYRHTHSFNLEKYDSILSLSVLPDAELIVTKLIRLNISC